MLGLGTVVGIAFTLLNHVLGPRRAVRSKADPYESGLPSDVQRGFRSGISSYPIAMPFILFDIEVIFLYPVAAQLTAYGTFAMSEAIMFIVRRACAVVYVWRRG